MDTRSDDLDERARVILDGRARHHEGYGIPSNAHCRRHAWQEPDRTEPRPLSRADVRDALILLPVAILVIVGLIVGIGYFLVTLGPVR